MAISEGEFNRLVETLHNLYVSIDAGKGGKVSYGRLQDYMYTQEKAATVEKEVLEAIPVGYWEWIPTPTLKVQAVKQAETRCLRVEGRELV